MNQASVPQCVIPMFMLMLCSTFGLQYVAGAQEKKAEKPAQLSSADKESTEPASSTAAQQAATVQVEKESAATDLAAGFDFRLLSNAMICSPKSLLDGFTAHPQNTGRSQITEKIIEPKAIEPKLQLPQASKEVAVVPHEQKLHNVSFAQPDAESKQAPKMFHASAYAFQGRTRSGVKTQTGTIAADPRVLPLGTVVQVNAGKYSGVYTVHDTGGAIKGNRVDVWMPTTKEARRFGRRQVKLVVLRYPGQNKPTEKTGGKK